MEALEASLDSSLFHSSPVSPWTCPRIISVVHKVHNYAVHTYQWEGIRLFPDLWIKRHYGEKGQVEAPETAPALMQDSI